MRNKKEKLLIFDADCFLYFTGWHYKDNMNMINVAAARKHLDDMLTAILNKHKANKFLGFFGAVGNENFRNKIATIRPYKGSRKKEPWQEYFIPKLKAHYEKKWGFYPIKYMEADDAVVVAHNQFKDDYDILHISEDKDFVSQVAAKRYNPNGKKKVIQSWDDAERIRHFYYQMLLGGFRPYPSNSVKAKA